MPDDEQDSKKPPETQTEVEMDGPKKPPRSTAVGVREYNFKPGANYVCKLMKKVDGGYNVWAWVGRDGWAEGFLYSEYLHTGGEEILVRCLRVEPDKTRAVFEERYRGGPIKTDFHRFIDS